MTILKTYYQVFVGLTLFSHPVYRRVRALLPYLFPKRTPEPGASAPKRSTMENILARTSIGISELKINPTAVIERANGPVAVLNRNKPIAYLIPARAWEAVCERLGDLQLAEIVRKRSDETPVNVKLDEL